MKNELKAMQVWITKVMATASDLVKVEILLQGDPVDAFSSIVHRDKAYDYGQKMTKKLRELIPRQQFDVPIQAAISSKIISRETVKAYRKDVLQTIRWRCHRKNQLLKKQKKAKSE